MGIDASAASAAASLASGALASLSVTSGLASGCAMMSG
jgi:hypothetical protein